MFLIITCQIVRRVITHLVVWRAKTHKALICLLKYNHFAWASPHNNCSKNPYTNSYIFVIIHNPKFLGPIARAHSFVGPKGPGPIGPILEDSFEEVIGFSHF